MLAAALTIHFRQIANARQTCCFVFTRISAFVVKIPSLTPLFPAAREFKLGGGISWSLSARLATVSIWHRDKHLLTGASFTPLVWCWLLNKALTQISDVYTTNDMSYLGRVLQGRHRCWCNIICERNASLKLQCCANGKFRYYAADMKLQSGWNKFLRQTY